MRFMVLLLTLPFLLFACSKDDETKEDTAEVVDTADSGSDTADTADTEDTGSDTGDTATDPVDTGSEDTGGDTAETPPA